MVALNGTKDVNISKKEERKEKWKHLDLRDTNCDYLFDHKVNKDRKIYLLDTVNLDESKKISALSDVMFKTLYYNDERLDYSAKLLSYFVDVPFEKLKKNLKLNKELLNKRNYYEKSQQVDYVAKFDNTYLNIEINSCSDEWVFRRNMIYAFRLMHRDNKIKTENEEIMRPQSIVLNINNFAYEGIDEVIRKVMFRDEKGVVYSDSPIIIQIYLPNIRKKVYNIVNKELVLDEEKLDKLEDFEKLLLLSVEQDIKDCEKIRKDDEFMARFLKDMVKASRDEEILSSYDKEAEQRAASFSDGYDDGHDDGVAQNRREVAEAMLQENLDISLISKISKLTEKEIEEIKKKLEV